MNFIKVEENVRALKKKVEAGELDQMAFEEKLMSMIDVANDGYYWMFGHKTEQWYRHDGHRWIPDDPGELLANANTQPTDEHAANLDPAEEWASLEIGWFALSLTLVAVIFLIVYTSTP